VVIKIFFENTELNQYIYTMIHSLCRRSFSATTIRKRRYIAFDLDLKRVYGPATFLRFLSRPSIAKGPGPPKTRAARHAR
jgi:hypothetical protein